MSGVLGAAWRTITFGWRFGSALVTAAVAGVIGLVVGFVLFALVGLLVPKQYGNMVWNGGILLTPVVFAVLAFLGHFRRPAAPPDIMGSAAWATPRQVVTGLAAPALRTC